MLSNSGLKTLTTQLRVWVCSSSRSQLKTAPVQEILARDSTRDILAVVHQVFINWNHPMIPSFSRPPTLYPAPAPSTIRASPSPNSAATSTPGSNGSGGGVGGNGSEPQVAAAHNAPPAKAIAVPLYLTGVIILLAAGLALHHRRQLAAEKECAWSFWSS
ncbi:hypothetical protein F5888DRAFT_1804411 [Russula emetica]|nr:hypothetical protein F5888DRAFT_1804411 [Russula emetica]